MWKQEKGSKAQVEKRVAIAHSNAPGSCCIMAVSPPAASGLDM